MYLKETIAKNHKFNLDEFEIERIVAEPFNQYRLFENELPEIKTAQLKIFIELEKKIPFFNGSSFSNHVHFQNAHQTPVQRWYPYREGYSSNLVNSFLKEYKISGNVFDPFMGSGTTLLSARMNNLKSYGIDVNPISVIIATVENEIYSKDDLKIFEHELSKLKKYNSIGDNHEISYYLAEKVFNKDILKSIISIKQQIDNIDEIKIKNLFFVAWLSIIEDVSNIKKEGNGIKYKNRKRITNGYIDIPKEVWENNNFPEDKFTFVKNRILQKLEIILYDLKYCYGNSVNKPKIFNGNCLEFNSFFPDEIEFTFFSPPFNA
jgi:hypothetical protein